MPAPSTMSSATPLIEIFSSIQGEGELAGYRQIFIRFPGCNLTCSYCDTPLEAEQTCRVEAEPGSNRFETLAQPVGLETVLALVHRWCKQLPGVHHSISITGGEPMLHADLLATWLPELNILLPIHLETNGTLPEQLPRLIEHLDYISMDIKLPSTAGTPELWSAHRKFLEIALERNVSVKLIVGDDTSEQDLASACKLVAELDDELPLILQPMTGKNGKVAIAPERLMRYQAVAARFLSDVRVLPQMHRFLGVA